MKDCGIKHLSCMYTILSPTFSNSTVFQSYQGDGRVIMKDCGIKHLSCMYTILSPALLHNPDDIINKQYCNEQW